jgi:periplasmic copper chaperone A
MKPFAYALAGLAVAIAVPAFAHDGVHIDGAYARFLPGAMSGAAFMVIENHATVDDRLIGAASDVAKRVELHTHKAGEGGMMQMIHVPEGFVIPAGETHELKRGGDHVMLMGPTRKVKDGDTITVTLTFEHAGDVTVEIPVDNTR